MVQKTELAQKFCSMTEQTFRHEIIFCEFVCPPLTYLSNDTSSGHWSFYSSLFLLFLFFSPLLFSIYHSLFLFFLSLSSCQVDMMMSHACTSWLDKWIFFLVAFLISPFIFLLLLSLIFSSTSIILVKDREKISSYLSFSCCRRGWYDTSCWCEDESKAISSSIGLFPSPSERFICWMLLLVPSLILPFVRWCFRSFVDTFVPSLILSFLRLFIRNWKLVAKVVVVLPLQTIWSFSSCGIVSNSFFLSLSLSPSVVSFLLLFSPSSSWFFLFLSFFKMVLSLKSSITSDRGLILDFFPGPDGKHSSQDYFFFFFSVGESDFFHEEKRTTFFLLLVADSDHKLSCTWSISRISRLDETNQSYTEKKKVCFDKIFLSFFDWIFFGLLSQVVFW